MSVRDVSSLDETGQLVYYVQAADVPVHYALRHRKDLLLQACNVSQMTQTGGLMSVLPLYLGMRVKLTKKILPPELVQEASGEIVRIAFHDDEGFGYGRPRGQRLHCPPSSHPCWAIGWVLCDRLPTYVAVRFDKVTEDYTGLEQLGVWHVEPTNDEWNLKYKVAYCVQHPRSPSKKTGHKDNIIKMIRHQIPLAPERIGTYQNQQGKTVRGPEDEPLGHTISLRKPSYLHDDEYKQHLYMILGRAKALKWTLFHNFPSDAQGLPEWKWFESGPPRMFSLSSKRCNHGPT